MDERVSRRGAFRKVLSDGVNVLARILNKDPIGVSHLHSNADMSPEQAGHLLRTRKTTKSNSGIYFRNHQKCDPSSKVNDR